MRAQPGRAYAVYLFRAIFSLRMVICIASDAVLQRI
jgi:hypothetical protein